MVHLHTHSFFKFHKKCENAYEEFTATFRRLKSIMTLSNGMSCDRNNSWFQGEIWNYFWHICEIQQNKFEVKFLFVQKSDNNNMTNMKIASEVQCTVVVVGDSRTGKTSLIQRFVNNTFNQVRKFSLLMLCYRNEM